MRLPDLRFKGPGSLLSGPPFVLPSAYLLPFQLVPISAPVGEGAEFSRLGLRLAAVS